MGEDIRIFDKVRLLIKEVDGDGPSSAEWHMLFPKAETLTGEFGVVGGWGGEKKNLIQLHHFPTGHVTDMVVPVEHVRLLRKVDLG